MTAQEPPSRPRLFLQLLGGFAAALDGSPLPSFPYDKLRALLAYLALERGRDFPRGWLAEMLWPDLEGAAARQNLRRALSNLRGVLQDRAESAYFSISRSGLGLRPDAPVDLDAADFLVLPAACGEYRSRGDACLPCLRRMEAAVGRYGGELLAGFGLADSPEFDKWLDARRDAIHRHVLVMLDRLSACHRAIGDHGRALAFALRYLELEPWDEAAICRVMRLHAAAGQAAAALARYESFRRELARELELLPGEAVRRLAEDIRGGRWQGDEPGAAVPSLPAPVSPERRQVTAVYCELVPGGAEDPDELAETLPLAVQRCEELMRGFGGHPVASPGGALAYFGYPRAREKEALQAVRAAWTMAPSLAGSGLQVRVGIHTGLVLTGGSHSLPEAAGETSALAMRLPLLCGPGSVVLSEATYRLVADYFLCQSLGSASLRGLDRPVEALQVLAPTDLAHRLQAMRRRLTPFVGREGEFDRLLTAWRQVRAGQRRCLFLSGEPGIGKSRLVQALRETLEGDGVPAIEMCCQAEFSQEALQPLAVALAQLAGIVPEDSAAVALGKLAAAATRHFPAAPETARRLAAWILGLGGDGFPSDGSLDERQRRFAALFELLEAFSRGRPLLLVIEDLHWADPSTLDLIDTFVARGDGMPVMVVATARPDYVPDWPADRCERLVLGQLPVPAVRAMIDAMTRDRALPGSMVQRIIGLADGVPLFVEETTRMLLDAGAGAGVPNSLRDLLAARLDSVGPAKTTAQCAAVLGREFLLDQLAHLAEMPPAGLEAALARLESQGLVVRDATTCQFRHALIREAAYDSLPRRSRRSLHLRAARMLEERWPHLAESQPGLLAQHYAAAGEAGRALDFHLLAAELAQRHSAYREVIGHFRQGLEQLALLPESRQRAERELEILARLGMVLGEVEGLGSESARETYNRAFELCREIPGSPQLFQTLYGIWRGSSSWSDFDWSLQLGNQLLAMAEEEGDPHRIALACYTLGNVHCFRGDLEASRRYLERCIELYRPDMPVDFCGESAGVNGLSFLSWVLTLQGHARAGLERSREALALARRLEQPAVLCFALVLAAELRRMRREPEEVVRHAGEAIVLAEKCGLQAWAVFADGLMGWAGAFAGDAAGPHRVRECLERIRGSIMASSATPVLAWLAEACLAVGDLVAGLAAAEEGLALGTHYRAPYLEPAFLRLKDDFLAALAAG